MKILLVGILLALLLLLLGIVLTPPQEPIVIVVTATPAVTPTPTLDLSACWPQGRGWFYCP